jgi:alkanesulfonate monooxygenase
MRLDDQIRTFSTCAPSNKCDRATYLNHVIDVARWSEAAGCEGILVYTDNGLVDPWLLAQVIVQSTDRICPLVAVQPAYMHPYGAAKMIATIGHLYGRRLWINMVAGGFKNDLTALGEDTPHDRRYDRVVEYASIVLQLLEAGRVVSHEGDFYRVSNLKMVPPLDPELRPGLTMSGSSEAGLVAARKLGGVAVQYPQPVDEYEANPIPDDLEAGIRIGIIARHDAHEAWKTARQRFPEDRSGQLAHQLAMKVSDSVWHRQLSELGEHEREAESVYWLVPFENYKTFCPYLVGDYDTVAREVARYIAVGYETFILDVPESPEELEHIGVVFERARRRAE